MNSPRLALRSTGLLALVASVAFLAACDKSEPTAGQQVDRAISATENAAAEMKADTKAATEKATQAITATAADISITAKVKAELAADPGLSALRIDVDTRDGRVALSGTAPTDTARERATSLAQSVQGVVTVDNRLLVEPKS